MGRQGGIGIFLGSVGDLNGYVDDGKALWRRRSGLEGARWWSHPHLGGQRRAAELFSGASVVAGGLWSALPAAMRRLADGGAFNRLVGHCRVLMGADGQLEDPEGLLSLDLSVDSLGPHRLVGGLGSLELKGLRDLMRELDDAEGCWAGRSPDHFVVANRFQNDGVTRDSVDWKTLGFCHRWGKRYRDRHLYGHGTAERRVRVWVWASKVISTQWNAGAKVYVAADGAVNWSQGFVSPWLLASDSAADRRDRWARSVAVDGADILADAPAGDYVVFSAVEVAEKRGRHWVRLPWCCKVRVQGFVAVEAAPCAEVVVLRGLRAPLRGLRSGFRGVGACVVGLRLAPVRDGTCGALG